METVLIRFFMFTAYNMDFNDFFLLYLKAFNL